MNGPMEERDVVAEVYEEYVSAFREGRGDPSPFLERLGGEQRAELELLIDAFLAAGPVPDVDAIDFDGPRLTAMAEQVAAGLDGAAGALSGMLTELRSKLGVNQADVVRALADDFEATREEEAKIDDYYHDLEWGTLPASGLSAKVYAALAAILETDPESLKKAARALGPPRASSTGPIYARMADDSDVVVGAEIPGQRSPAVGPPDRRASPPDRIDLLFTGGRDD